MSKNGLFSPGEMRDFGIIQGWREIGRYIGRSGRTARRWYDKYSFPVRRSCTGRPFAFKYELNLWILKVDELIKKDYSESREQERKQAAYMRSCKKGKSV